MLRTDQDYRHTVTRSHCDNKSCPACFILSLSQYYCTPSRLPLPAYMSRNTPVHIALSSLLLVRSYSALYQITAVWFEHELVIAELHLQLVCILFLLPSTQQWFKKNDSYILLLYLLWEYCNLVFHFWVKN